MLCLSSAKGVRSGGELKCLENPLKTLQQRPYQRQRIHICWEVTTKPNVKMCKSRKHTVLVCSLHCRLIMPHTQTAWSLLWWWRRTVFSYSCQKTNDTSVFVWRSDVYNSVWNRKWAGTARTSVCRDMLFLRQSITNVLRDLLCSVTHLSGMCFQSAWLGVSWWLQIHGLSSAMPQDHKGALLLQRK